MQSRDQNHGSVVKTETYLHLPQRQCNNTSTQMNEMYKRGQSLDLLGIDERIEECLNKRNLGDVEAVQTEIFEEINNIKHTLSHRQHKTEKQHTKVTTEERGSWE